MKLFILIAVVAAALASPEEIQRLYGAPNRGDHESSHHSDHHHHDAGDHHHSADLHHDAGHEAGHVHHQETVVDGDSSDLFNRAGELDIERGSEVTTNLKPSVTRVNQVISGGVLTAPVGDVTVTDEITKDYFTTLTNVFYNSVPVTLTEFIKTTIVVPTSQIVRTPVDDSVFVAKDPVTRTDTVTVTDTNTAYRFATEVSTATYTVTHRAYDIQQQVVTSTVLETQLVRPTVVSTVIMTERETSVITQTITNTVVLDSNFRATNIPLSGSSQEVDRLLVLLGTKQREISNLISQLRSQQEISRYLQQANSINSEINSFSPASLDIKKSAYRLLLARQDAVLQDLRNSLAAQQGRSFDAKSRGHGYNYGI